MEKLLDITENSLNEVKNPLIKNGKSAHTIGKWAH
jgi:hypothetical protein